MPFGKKADPTIVYAFHCRVAEHSLKAVVDQQWAAHRYRNRLVEIERERRLTVEAMMREVAPDLLTSDQQITECKALLDQLYEQAMAERKASRKRVLSPDLAARIKAAKLAFKVLITTTKDRRKAVFESDDFKQRQDVIEEAHHRTLREARGSCGAYWGSYLCVEASMQDARKGAPPEFQRWDGQQLLGVQFQKGASPAEIGVYHDDGDTRAQVDMDYKHPEGHRNPWRKARIRIGSNGRMPIWADLLIKPHRPIPADCRITEARRRAHPLEPPVQPRQSLWVGQD
jgi:hypothetical protein